MRWSKLKSEVEKRICDSLKNEVSIYSTRYGNCTCGHAWLTLNKEIIANFCTRAFWNTRPTFDREKNKFVHGDEINNNNSKYDDLYVEYGEMSRQDVYEACWEFIHNLNIDDALNSDDPLIQTLAVIDKRVGKNRLKKIDKEKLHPLALKLLQTRIAKENRYS